MDLKDQLISAMAEALAATNKYNSALVQLNEVTTTVSELKIRINDLQHTVREQQKHLEYNKRLSSTSKQLFFLILLSYFTLFKVQYPRRILVY